MSQSEFVPVGTWTPTTTYPAMTPEEVAVVVPRIRESVHVVWEGPGGRLGLAPAGSVAPSAAQPGQGAYHLMATLPAFFPEWLGDRSFNEAHGTRFPYIAGAMANGISTPELVIAMARAGMLGFYGAGGLGLERIEQGVAEIQQALGQEGGQSWGSNLIHAPHEPELEAGTVELYLRRGVARVSASAYMKLTPPLVRYACSGLSVDPAGVIQRRNHVFAKISRTETARLFLEPPPAELLAALVSAGGLTQEEATLAGHLPLAEDITVEADSGGHTDNRPLGAIFPTVARLRDAVAAQRGYVRPVRLGAAGGLGAPEAVAAAFALGAAYVLTGSVNQAALESGLSVAGRAMLAGAGIADVTMAPSPDMFELGVKVQVLRRGTLFSQRAARLYELYMSSESLEALDPEVRGKLEQEIFKAPLAEIWEQTQAFFARRSPAEIERGEASPKHRMGLVFRWYLGQASRWAMDGEAGRELDFQIWCGPAMGAFNAWARGSFLEPPEGRSVAQIALNLLEGAAVATRAQQVRSYGVPVPSAAFCFAPRPLA